MAFAKLFDVEGFGQVLAKLGTDEDGAPELRWFAKPPGLGVCEFAIGFFSDDEDGWVKAEAALGSANAEAAREAAVVLWRATGTEEPSNA